MCGAIYYLFIFLECKSVGGYQDTLNQNPLPLVSSQIAFLYSRSSCHLHTAALLQALKLVHGCSQSLGSREYMLDIAGSRCSWYFPFSSVTHHFALYLHFSLLPLSIHFFCHYWCLALLDFSASISSSISTLDLLINETDRGLRA